MNGNNFDRTLLNRLPVSNIKDYSNKLHFLCCITANERIKMAGWDWSHLA